MPRKQTRLTQYRRLIRQRRADCSFAQYGLVNPASTRYDVKHLGSYATWAGNLEADLVVVLCDGRSLAEYCAAGGLPTLKADPEALPRRQRPCTNGYLLQLLRSIGRDIGLPQAPKEAGVFLADAVPFIGLRSLPAHLKRQVHTQCMQQYVAPLIRIIKPRVVVTAGLWPTKAFFASVQPEPSAHMPLRNLYDQRNHVLGAPYPILGGHSSLYPMYHPGHLGIRRRGEGHALQGWQAMLHDWQSMGLPPYTAGQPAASAVHAWHGGQEESADLPS